jgi:hypothetical protein
MIKTLALLLPLLAVVASCGEAGTKIADELQAKLDTIDIKALKAKAEASGTEAKSKAIDLISQLQAKKTEAVDAVKRLASGDVATSVITKAKDSVGDVMRLFEQVKKALGL